MAISVELHKHRMNGASMEVKQTVGMWFGLDQLDVGTRNDQKTMADLIVAASRRIFQDIPGSSPKLWGEIDRLG